jgi:hypothetical protein
MAGVCKCCCYVTFGHCMRHSTFLTRADIQLDIVVGTPPPRKLEFFSPIS